MKKLISFCTLGLLTAAVLAGCSQQKTETETGESPVVLGEYKGITYTPLSTEVTDEQLDIEIKNFMSDYVDPTPVDRPAELGDTVNIDYVGLLDGVAFDGGTAEAYDLQLGSGTFIPGFEDGLVGVSKGDERDLNLTFPEDYGSADLAGQSVVFQVKVNDVLGFPELDEDFVTSYTDFTTVDEFVQSTRDSLVEAAESRAQSQAQYDVFQKVMENCKINVSDEDIQKYYDEIYSAYENMATGYGLDLETLVGYMGMDLETFQGELRASADTAVQQLAVIKAIAEKEGITVEQADLEKLAEEYGYDSVEALTEDAGDDAESTVLADKVMAFLVENAVAE